MSPALLDRPAAPMAEPSADRSAGGGRLTLEQRLDAAWHLIRAGAEAECPVCREPMRLELGAGRCHGCGSRLT